MQCFFCAKLLCLSPRTHFAVIFDFPFGIASKEAAAMVLPRSLARKCECCKSCKLYDASGVLLVTDSKDYNEITWLRVSQ